MVVHAIGGSV
jgi:hypothetical protein